jgi:hypothetical protein
MSGEESLRSVEEQISACERFGTYLLKCPYCGTENNAENEALCCKLLGMAVAAVLHRKQVGDGIRKLDELMESASRN